MDLEEIAAGSFDMAAAIRALAAAVLELRARVAAAGIAEASRPAESKVAAPARKRGRRAPSANGPRA